MTSPTDKGAPGEGGPYRVEVMEQCGECLRGEWRVVADNGQWIGNQTYGTEGEAGFYARRLNAAHQLGFEAGARAAEQAAAATIAQLEAALGPARERIEQLEAEQRALLARIEHMQAALEAKLGEEMEP